MTPAVLVTLAQAKAQLYIRDTDHDPDVQLKLDIAEGTVRGFLKARDDPAWTAATAPAEVVGAILFTLTHLYENRGDALEGDALLWDALGRLLARRRDPTLA